MIAATIGIAESSSLTKLALSTIYYLSIYLS